MIKRLVLISMLIMPFSVTCPGYVPKLASVDLLAAESPEMAMHNLQILLKKLRDSLASIKDMDDLAKAGMPQEDVNRMKKAMHKKIQNMINEAINIIQDL